MNSIIHMGLGDRALAWFFHDHDIQLAYHLTNELIDAIIAIGVTMAFQVIYTQYLFFANGVLKISFSLGH